MVVSSIFKIDPFLSFVESNFMLDIVVSHQDLTLGESLVSS